jgi:hypothetical protein
MAPTYRERLRTEGLVLAGAGAVGSAVLLATQPQARRWPLNTIGQLALAGAVMATAGRRKVSKALDEAIELQPGHEGGGAPTPLWHLPVPMLVLTAVVSGALLPADRGLRYHDEPLAGWDVGLRATAGSMLAGLAQALLFEREVAQAETIQGRTYYRVPGSGLFSGTELGYTRRA